MFVRPETGTGLWRGVVEPSPTSPTVLRPQAQDDVAQAGQLNRGEPALRRAVAELAINVPSPTPTPCRRL